MSLTPVSRRRAEEFAELVEAGSVAEVSALRAMGAGLAAAPLGPDPAFAAALRTRLLAVAAVAPHRSAASAPVRQAVSWRSQRRVAAATGGLAAVVAVAGVGVAGEQSLPGEAFYGVKMATERVELFAARGDVARGEQHLHVAETRLDEVTALLAGSRLGALGPGLSAAGDDRAELVAETLVAMDVAYRAGSTLLVRAWQSDADPEVLRTLDQFTLRQQERLQALMPALPVLARPPAQASLDLLQTVSLRTGSLLAGVACEGACAGEPAPGSTVTPSPGPDGPGAPTVVVPGAPAPAAPGEAPSGGPVPAGPPAPGATPAPAPPAGGPAPADGSDDDDVEDLLDVLVPAAPTRSPAPTTGPTGVPGPGLPVVPSAGLPVLSPSPSVPAAVPLLPGVPLPAPLPVPLPVPLPLPLPLPLP